MSEFTADKLAASRRVAQLKNYFDEHVLAGGQFICSTEQQCKASHRGNFYAGQLPHIGEYYDLARDGVPFRIVVVGQEYGSGHELVDLDARRTMIVDTSGASSRFRALPPMPGRNPHMKGCTSVLRLLFGKDLGSDHEGEFIAVKGVPVHLFNCFALVNFLLCSAVPTEPTPALSKLGGRPGRSTRVMRQNCARHFKIAIEILEPTVLVLQGRGVFRWMKKTIFETLSDDLVQTIEVNEKPALVWAFTHPSAREPYNWGTNDRTPYLINVVAPTVRRTIAGLA